VVALTDRSLRGRWCDEFVCIGCRARCAGVAVIIGELAICWDCAVAALTAVECRGRSPRRPL
jgi:hypothetical protein